MLPVAITGLTKRLPARQRMRQRIAVNKFELAPHGHTVGNTAHSHGLITQGFTYVMRRGFAFNGGIGGQNKLAHRITTHPLQQARNTQLARAYTVEGRKMALEHEIKTAIGS